MGEAKRRQESLGDKYGKKSDGFFQWNVSKKKLITWTIEGLIFSVLSLAGLWLTFYFFPGS